LWVPAIRVPGAGLMHHSDFIAGKPAPTGLMQLLWGLAAGDSHRFDAVVVGAGLPAIRALAQR